MRLPQKKKPGDPVLAKDWNLLLEALAARSPKPGAGLELISSSGGFAYSMPPGPGVPRQSLPPFAVIGIHRAGLGWEVLIKEGWVIERKPRAHGDEPAVKFHMPEFGGVKLDTVPRPSIGMAFGDYLYCKYQCDVKGEVSGTPELIVSADEEDGVHYKPADPEESGVAGEYFVKLLKLESDGGSPRAKVYQQSDIEHWGQLWTGLNVGGGARVYKKHEDNENRFKFRTLLGGYGITELEGAETITFDFEGANLGSGQIVYLPEGHADKTDEEKAEFRSIDKGGSGRDEIEVYRKDAGTIGIRGNGIDGTIQLSEAGVVTVLIQSRDGLVKVISPTTIHVRPYKVCEGGYPVTKRFLTLD